MEEFKCTFCGKQRREVKKLVSGPRVFICDECIELCSAILAGEGAKDLGMELLQAWESVDGNEPVSTPPLDDVVAERAITFAPSDGEPTEISIRVSRPKIGDAGQQGWQCRFEIMGAGAPVRSVASGTSSLNALIHSLRTIDDALSEFAKTAEGSFPGGRLMLAAGLDDL